ncbi:CASP-like protein 2B1 [Glycine soja]|uniref:CASP-like protein n=1 Tax=Glycine soja TaxID=3848 RepID=A0A445LQC4_GLYSO|nr:CASP-like protein 2B1 [Glycine soja]
MSFLGLGFSLGTVPVCHGAKHKVLDRRVRITKLVLRCVSLGLGVVAIVLVVTDSQVKEFFSFQKKAKFTDMKALIGRQRRRGERRRHPLGNKPWKKELHHQECALDKKLGEDASMEEKKERGGSTKLKEEKRKRS